MLECMGQIDGRTEKPTSVPVCGVLVWRLKFGSVLSGLQGNHQCRIHHGCGVVRFCSK
jgi:hypothetical protein